MKSLKIRCYVVITAFIIVFQAQAQTQIGADIDGEAANDQSGFSVSMPDAHTVAIGANSNDGSAINAGHVRIYRWNGAAWIQKGTDIDGEAANDYSGSSVSMPDSNTVAIGATCNSGNGTRAGHVRVYEWNVSAWVQKGNDIDGEAAYDYSGLPVSMPDANTVAIGASANSGNGPNAGQVRVYKWNGVAWVQKGADIDGEASSDESGYAVSMPDSNTVAIGAPYNAGSGVDGGHVRVYSWNGGSWVQKGNDIDGESAGDEFGWAISMPDSNTMAIGAHTSNGSDTLSGHVSVYSWNGNAWVKKGSNINGEAAHDFFGSTVSMPNSNTLAIGAIGNAGNGPAAGHVRVFGWTGNAWEQMGTDIDAESAGDQCGWAVSMPNANTVAIGARGNDGNGNSAGQVRVFHVCATTSISINASACESYISPSGNYTWTSGGTYVDTISNVAGCDSVITVQLEISYDHAVTIDTTINAGASFAVGSNIYDTSGIYMDTLTTIQGCDSIITTHLTIEIPTAVYPLSSNNEMFLYPNPVGDQLYIESTENISWVKIYDVMGSLVKWEQVAGTTISISTTHLGSGIYFVQAGGNDDRVRRGKMLKK